MVGSGVGARPGGGGGRAAEGGAEAEGEVVNLVAAAGVDLLGRSEEGLYGCYRVRVR